MARTAVTDFEKMSAFGKWITRRLAETGKNVNQVADHVGMSPSQLHKIIKSYKPQYAAYQRPGYERTKAIGVFLGDIPGALTAANYEDGDSHPAPSSAISLVREVAARFGAEKLGMERVQEISEELEDFARVRVDRVMRQKQEAA